LKIGVWLTELRGCSAKPELISSEIVSPVYMALTLPRPTDSRWKMTSDLRSARKQWRCNCQRRGECDDISSRTSVSTNVVFVGSKLSALRCDTLEVLLSRCIRIANLKQEALFANRLTMEFLDDLFTDLTSLETEGLVRPRHSNKESGCKPSKADTTAVIIMIT